MRSGNGIRSIAKVGWKAAALGASTLAMSASGAWAQQFAAYDEQQTITVTGQRGDVESPKYVAPLLDTPQTVTVVSSELIEQQNLLNLRDILSTIPGITFGAGEGGGGYGDSINLRGFAASNDVGVDGVRDSAQYSRTDPFNLEQVEVVNGASSVYSGGGSVGGTINLVSKAPVGAEFTRVNAGLGTDEYSRATLDSNREIGEGIAVRLNAMAHENNAPGRDYERFSRWGVAPSITFGANSPTQFTILYVHQEDDNVPQYGVPYYQNAFNDGPLPGADPSNYYGYHNIDAQEIQLDQLTGRIEHKFSEELSVRNLTRYQEVSQLSIVGPPQGTWCLASGINVSTGAACASPNTYAISGPRGNTRDTANTLLYNQTDLTWRADFGGLANTMVVGASFLSETFHLDTGNVYRNPNGATPNPTFPAMSISDPDSYWTGPVNFILGGGALANATGATCNTTTLAGCVAPSGTQDGERQNQAIYVFDALELGDHWELNGGLRYEHAEGWNSTGYVTAYGYLPSNNGSAIGAASAAAPAGVYNGQGLIFRSDDMLLSYRVGVVYKPIESASLYLAYGNSQTPSQATVNGSGACSAATCNVDAEEAVSYEFGGKMEIMDGRLLLTAAIFRNDRTNYRVASNDPTLPDQQLDGQARVDGVALGAAGRITDALTVFANYTYLDSEVLQGVSDFCLANPTVPACATALAANNGVAGNPLLNVPDHSFSLWSTYTLGALEFGYGATYAGEYYLSNGAGVLYTAPSYWVHNASIAYQATEKLSVRLNVNNLLDEEYYQRVRNNGWATPGPARQAVVSLAYEF